MLPSYMLVSPALPALLPSCNGLQHRKNASDNISRNPIGMNTSKTSRKCTSQATYRCAQSFKINTYKKARGRGALSLTTNPKKDLYPEEHRDEGPLRPTKDFCPERPPGARDLSFQRRTSVPRSKRVYTQERPQLSSSHALTS